MKENSCKKCRRARQKLFLKGEKCFSPKCPLIRKPYAPGEQNKKRRSKMSEYGKELMEKQKMRRWYGLSERQFKKYVETIMSRGGEIEDAGLALIKLLEKRLDNVVFRLGLAPSRRQARQIVSHSHFRVNGKAVNIPSYQVSAGDKIEVKETKKDKKYYKNLALSLKKVNTPSWLKLNPEKISGEITGEPSFEDSGAPVEVSSVFELYSR